VEDYLSVITRQARQAGDTPAPRSAPMLTKLKGALQGDGDIQHHRDHLAAKYK
jgi:hypothetical protein